jgi:N-acetylglucosaminyldiphosphoundecaprenol N-acetyl-beta-D-mannosaminyltransferase
VAELPSISLLGFPLHALTTSQTLDHIVSEASARRGGWVVTPNLDILRQLVTNSDTRELCSGSTLFVADGMPLIWASRLQRTPLPERVTGSDMVISLTRRAAEAGLRLSLVGGDILPDGTRVADQAAAKLREQFPTLQIASIDAPPYGFDDAYVTALAQRLVAARPDIIYVAIGFPKQERLIARLRPHLPGAWFLGIGISFSFVTGSVQRAPRWMQKCGLEWSHRLAQEPGRLAKRYLVQGLPFAAHLLISSAWRGLRGG